MKKLPTDSYVDIKLFKNDLKDIDEKFIRNIESIFKIILFNSEMSYLFMTNDATYVYGKEICKWLWLKHDPKRPQQINILNGKKIIQVESGHNFIVVLTDDGSVYLASDDSFWQTKNTLRLISTDNDRFEMIACGYYHLLLLRKDGIVFAFGYNKYGQLTGDAKVPTKIPIENVQSVACMNNFPFSLALDQSSHYYVLNWMKDSKWLPFKKLNGQPKSFAAASAIVYESPITYGLTSTIYVFDLHDPISFIGLLNNPENYDVEFVIGDKRIMALKYYLKMTSKYYSRMFSGDWQKDNRVTIHDYSYDVYYSYLHMLHTGRIRIKQYNIFKLIDLANCYGDERLMKHCQTFIQKLINQ
uniref:RCC1 and BTB domain-containing protein 1-like n=1 Tax=Dermatophagoides pteronyssinus TaxID=6956 RepID=A0A6P6XWT0_DERPT|nr:RCC1 and BTB domain-containing protein 1-like [Dermatophagoides pteronyssinus]